MLLKLLLKIWPALVPILSYLIWVYVIQGFVMRKLRERQAKKEGKIIEGEFVKVGEKSTAAKSENNDNSSNKAKESFQKFSLENPQFVLVLYLSLIFAIITLLVVAFS